MPGVLSHETHLCSRKHLSHNGKKNALLHALAAWQQRLYGRWFSISPPCWRITTLWSSLTTKQRWFAHIAKRECARLSFSAQPDSFCTGCKHANWTQSPLSAWRGNFSTTLPNIWKSAWALLQLLTAVSFLSLPPLCHPFSVNNRCCRVSGPPVCTDRLWCAIVLWCSDRARAGNWFSGATTEQQIPLWCHPSGNGHRSGNLQ